MSILVPFAVLPPLSSMHLPGICDDTGPAGSVQAWFLKPLHEPTTTRVLLAVLKPVSDRHIPDAGLRRVIGAGPSDPVMLRGSVSHHCCTGRPVQAASTTLAPLAGLELGGTRHLPWIRSVPSLTYVHCWAVLPLHVQMSAWVPFAELLPTSLRHLPPVASRTAPAGPAFGARLTVHVKEADPDPPRPSAAVTVGWYVPGAPGQPVTWPLPSMERPGGSPVAVKVGVCPDESLALNCRPTGLPAPVLRFAADCRSPEFSRVIMAGLTWSRSVFWAPGIPVTVPMLVYCQRFQVPQP